MMQKQLRFHPSEMMLHRYAEGTLRATASLWVKRHLAACYECRQSVSFSRSLRDALATVPADFPMDSALIDRVLAERRAGERAVLPVSDANAARSVSGLYRVLLSGAVAAVLLAVLVYRARTAPTPGGSTSASRAPAHQSSLAPADEFAVSEFFVPKSAFATELPPDSATPPLTFDGQRLRPGIVRYSRFERVRQSPRRLIGTESVELAETQIEGRSA